MLLQLKIRKMMNDHRFLYFDIAQVTTLDRHASTYKFQNVLLKHFNIHSEGYKVSMLLLASSSKF